MPFIAQAPTYATDQDLMACGVPPAALSSIPPEERRRALYQASRFADTRLASRYSLPLTYWGDDLIQIVCVIAGVRLITYRGWSPADPANAGVLQLYLEAKETLDRVAQGKATLDVQDTSPQPDALPAVMSDRPRGL